MNSSSNIIGWGNVRRRATLMLATVILAAAGLNSAVAQSAEGIKAAFLYNFAKFTDWPAGAFASDGAPITVGFIGADSLAGTFEQNVTGKNANGRDFAIKKLSSAADLAGCQIIFVGDASQASAVIGAAKGKPVLTVGDSDGFAAAGGMINFVDNGGKVGFDLDLGAIGGSGLKLNPKLQQVARNVKGG
jgi:hypothetical protein